MSDGNPYAGIADACTNASWTGTKPASALDMVAAMKALWHEFAVERQAREQAIYDEIREARKDPAFAKRQDAEHQAMMEHGFQPNALNPPIVSPRVAEAILRRADEIEAAS